MRAIAYQTAQPIAAETSLVDIELPDPVPGDRDLLVEIKAISVNPVDTKIRSGVTPEAGSWKVLGWDAAGIVRAVGPKTKLFKPGDEVFYAGAIDRPGANSELHVVDERLVGPKPATLDFAAAAALPLTAITAWEMLFDRLRINDRVSGGSNAILIIGGAGGVGSIAIQLARTLSNVTVLATASRPETKQWAMDLGAHHVLDHSRPLADEIDQLALGAPAFVFATTNTADHLADIAKLIAPQGRFGVIDDPKVLDIMPFKRKAVSVHWELMFARSLFKTPDMEEQHKLLSEVSRLVDAGKIRSTLTETLGTINAGNLKKAHALLESGTMKGKAVLAGF
ncbi:zinc-binding alcohol dehydrogenase family protein [Pararhizobium sp.]|uniref:zinc-binding alcohol dehydrogenase family protein n=1 Tax=Pararhizobium sp. TaxID=1977563 RepID=UPI0027191929|nr:zinc-binding alcohol dehydrogenase family protein [Pararhizobium sp.]MDO9418012.1 zinc-binding alcohol dehydrogenase family protein [Pararhizobium sp.]